MYANRVNYESGHDTNVYLKKMDTFIYLKKINEVKKRENQFLKNNTIELKSKSLHKRQKSPFDLSKSKN